VGKLMLHIVWYFFIFAFLGWCVEVIYAAVKTGKFVNRGFLSGPYCSIYGAANILVIYLLEPIQHNVFYMFLGSVVLTSAIELTAGLLLEKIFHQRWWDYSDKPFNIRGYICPMFSLMWGLACLIIADRIYPLIFSLVNWIPSAASRILLMILICLFTVDLIATVKSILKLNKKLEIIDEITLKIREASENLGEKLANKTIAVLQKKDDLEESLEAKIEILQADFAELKDAREKAFAHGKQVLNELQKAKKELLEGTTLAQKRLLKAFPGLKSLDHKEALEKLKNTILNGLGSSNEKENRDN
jgi:uncharacterized membrane protein